MTSRSKLMLSLAAVPAAFVLLLVASLALTSAASPLEPAGIGVTATSGSAGAAIGLRARGFGQDGWTRSVLSPNEPSETRWMVAGYNGVSGAEPLSFIPRADLDSTLFVQNPTGLPGTLVADFYDLSGAVVNSEIAMIPANGSMAIALDSLSGLPAEYEGSVVLMSDQPIHAVVNIQPDDTGILLSYNAVETADGTVILPVVFRDLYGWNSSFWVQNVGGDTADITLTYYDYGMGIVYVDSDSIAPFATNAYHLADETELPVPFAGLVLIESSQPVAVAVETVNLSAQTGVAWHGIPLAHGDPTILAPLQQKSAGIYSGTLIANLGDEGTSVEASWYAGDGSAIHSEASSILPYNTMQYMLFGMPGIPDGYDGSLVASSAGQPLGAIVRWQELDLLGDGYAESPAMGLGQVGQPAYLPRIVHSISAQAYTEFSIQNADSTSIDVTITFYDQSGAVSAVETDVIPSHGVSRYATGDVAALGDEWEGSVVVDATGPIAVEARQYMREPSTCPMVTDPGDSGPSTLRGCLEGAGSGDTITFDPIIFPPGSPTTIDLTSGPLPAITQDNLTLDATTAGVILDGGALGSGHGLHITSDGNLVQGMQILHFPGDGVRLDGGASYNLIGGDVEGERNVLSGNGGSGVVIAGDSTLHNTLSQNSIYGNSSAGIDLVDGGNMELPAPTITDYDLGAGTASGTACANCTVELFSDEQDEGRWFEGSTTADGSGEWSVSKGSAFHGPRLTTTATDAGGNTSEFGQDQHLVYLPLVLKNYGEEPSPEGLYGRVTYTGSPETGTELLLRFYDGSTWSTYATTHTDSNGDYEFTDPPVLSTDQYMYVRWVNEYDPSRLATWGCIYIFPTSGPEARECNFDVDNIDLVSPSPGASVSVPVTFRWNRRAITTDNYEVNLADRTDADPWWYQEVGYVDSYTLTGLPSGFVPYTEYGWWLWVYGPDGYGVSYYYNPVTFLNSGRSTEIQPIPAPRHLLEDSIERMMPERSP